MAKILIKIEKTDINTAKLGYNYIINCEAFDIVFSPEALDELLEDYKLLKEKK